MQYYVTYTYVYKPRNAETWSYKTAQLPIFQRGYTGHEHLAVFGLINMNYRLYDPVNARFISSDNLIPNITNTQSYNVYSYVLNNPLKYIDPDGHEPITIATILIGAAISGLFYTANVVLFQPGGFDNWSWSEFGKSVVIGGVSGAVGGWAVGAAGFGTVGFVNGAMSGLIGGSVGGFVNGALTSWTSGGSLAEGFANGLKGGVIGGLSGFGIGGIFGGISAYRHGGDFWSGKGSKFYNKVDGSKYRDLKDAPSGIKEVAEGLEYSKKGVNDFYEKSNLPKGIKGLKNITVGNDGISGVELKGDFAYAKIGRHWHEIHGVTSKLIDNASQINMFKGAFFSHNTLYMNLGHELLHAAYIGGGIATYSNTEHQYINSWENGTPFNGPSRYDPQNFGFGASYRFDRWLDLQIHPRF